MASRSGKGKNSKTTRSLKNATVKDESSKKPRSARKAAEEATEKPTPKTKRASQSRSKAPDDETSAVIMGTLIRDVDPKKAPSGPTMVKPEQKIKRRKIKHQWPPVGTVIVGRLKGQTIRAEIVEDPNQKKGHGRAVKSLDDPKLPPVPSISTAARSFTQAIRDKHAMSPIANAWKWWRREADNRRLFDIEEYSVVVEE